MIKFIGKTYEVNIWMGLNPGYGESDTSDLDQIQLVHDICQEYVECGLCVTVNDVQFIYTGGKESGVQIGLINYPRFPSKDEDVMQHAVELAYKLMNQLLMYLSFPTNC